MTDDTPHNICACGHSKKKHYTGPEHMACIACEPCNEFRPAPEKELFDRRMNDNMQNRDQQNHSSTIFSTDNVAGGVRECKLPPKCKVKDCHNGFIPRYLGGVIDCEACPCSCHHPTSEKVEGESEWEPEVSVWEKQGRTDEQIYAVRNFLTGQGEKMIKRLEGEAYKRGIQNGTDKPTPPTISSIVELDFILAELLDNALKDDLQHRRGKHGYSYTDYGNFVDKHIARIKPKLTSTLSTFKEQIEKKARRKKPPTPLTN